MIGWWWYSGSFVCYQEDWKASAIFSHPAQRKLRLQCTVCRSQQNLLRKLFLLAAFPCGRRCDDERPWVLWCKALRKEGIDRKSTRYYECGLIFLCSFVQVWLLFGFRLIIKIFFNWPLKTEPKSIDVRPRRRRMEPLHWMPSPSSCPLIRV